MNIKTVLNASLLGLGLASNASATPVKSLDHPIHEASYIQLSANSGQELQLAEFLKKGAELVRQTEPQTTLWFALKGEEGQFGIFDVFHNNEGRTAHFAGKVAAALHDNAPLLVNGGWDKGVLAHVQNSEILSANSYNLTNVLKATKASYILLKAQPGKEKDLAALLKDAAPIITQTEPGTSFWLALKIDDGTYAIFDTFTDEQARSAHFSGAVAAALKSNADTLVVGGWQEGVLNNVHNFDVVASS